MSDTKYTTLSGDVATLRTKAAAYTDLADKISQSVTALNALSDESETVSDAIAAIRDLSKKVKDDIGKAQGLYSAAGSALSTYANALEQAKNVADPAAARIAELEGDSKGLSSATWNAQEDYYEAKTKHQLASWSPDGTYQGHTEQYWQTQVTNAQSTLSTAQQNQATNASDLSWQKGQWETENGQGGGEQLKVTAAATAANAFDAVFDDSSVKGLEDSWWDRARDAWDKIYSVLSTICDIASVLSLFLAWVPGLGEVLLALAALGKILDAINLVMTIAGTITDIAEGKESWGAGLLSIGLSAVTVALDKVGGAKADSLLSKGSKDAEKFGTSLGKQFKSIAKVDNPFKDVDGALNSWKSLGKNIGKDFKNLGNDIKNPILDLKDAGPGNTLSAIKNNIAATVNKAHTLSVDNTIEKSISTTMSHVNSAKTVAYKLAYGDSASDIAKLQAKGVKDLTSLKVLAVSDQVANVTNDAVSAWQASNGNDSATAAGLSVFENAAKSVLPGKLPGAVGGLISDGVDFMSSLSQ